MTIPEPVPGHDGIERPSLAVRGAPGLGTLVADGGPFAPDDRLPSMT